MTEFTDLDRRHMRRALELAAHGLNTTTPNPSVGCVIANGETVVAEAWHERAGQAHAEAGALAKAGAETSGATVYVTLEPCTVHGRTPPCADALIAAGVARVVYAMDDPNPQVDGRGRAALTAAGVEVSAGLFAEQAAALNEGYVSRLTRGRPFVTMKWAQSLDGATAMRTGESQWITGEAARADAQHLRARACAILTGIGTVLADDPSMTVRLSSAVRQPLRVIADSQFRTPVDAKILNQQGESLVVGVSPCENRELAALTEVQTLSLPDSCDGAVDLVALLSHLADLGINELMVEAGARLSGAMLAAGLVDRIVAYVAPLVLGSETRGVVKTPSWASLADGRRLILEEVRSVGDDLRLQLVPLDKAE